MDQESDAGNDKDHQRREMIQHKTELRLETSRLNPREIVSQDGKFRLRPAQHRKKQAHRDQK